MILSAVKSRRPAPLGSSPFGKLFGWGKSPTYPIHFVILGNFAKPEESKDPFPAIFCLRSPERISGSPSWGNRMTHRKWSFRGLLGRLLSRGRPGEEICFQVSNLTRHSVLVSSLSLAGNGRARIKGLLGRDGLSAGEGLWILPCEAVHTFGMRFPIDLVYLDRKKRIRKLQSAVPPWRLSACFSAHSVLELAAGTIRATQTQLGDKLEFTEVSAPASATELPACQNQ